MSGESRASPFIRSGNLWITRDNTPIAVKESFTLGGAPSDETTVFRKMFKKTGIPDNTATGVLTVTIPNGNYSAAIGLFFVSANGGADAFESSRTARGAVVVARTLDSNAVAGMSLLTTSQIATVSGGATHAFGYSLSAIVGAATEANTFNIQVIIDDSGGIGSNQCVTLVELINSEANGLTIIGA